MKILVTGGAGYVGSVCARELVDAGHSVTIVDDFSTGNRDAVPAEATLVEGDVADLAAPLLSDGDFDAVVHFAARSLVGESVEHPADYWHKNFCTTLGLLDAMRDARVTNLVFSSSAATYGEPDAMPITEDTPTAPTNPYGATKLAIDHAITSYAAAYGLGATSLRYFNVAGAWKGLGENRRVETHIIPLLLQVARGIREGIKIFGDDWPTPDGTAVRDYIHIKDLSDAHLSALSNNTPGAHRIFNLGTGSGNSVLEVLEACRAVTGHPIPATIALRRAGDPAVLVASSRRAARELGWSPRFGLDEIVADAWEYARTLG